MPVPKIKSLYSKKTAVIVVDMQNAFVAEGAPIYSDMGHKMLEPMSLFLDQCRQRGFRIIYTEDCKLPGKSSVLQEGLPGIKIHPVVSPKENESVVRKYTYSGFFGTNMDLLLRSGGIDTVVIIGVCTDVCCFSTARDADFLGYQVIFLSDLTGTFAFPDMGFGPGDAQAQHEMALRNVAFTIGQVMDSSEFLALPFEE
ncbi:MAG: cysteine hydrolase [Peptococcaceae bacterium]|jgi:ureidoacrylate peracid hydrolase|nr:cysteine hydrolase [Peptococcaceae bacterium]